MRKNFNKLATLALSGMMVMSMAVPAMAGQHFSDAELKIPFTKTLYVDGETLAPRTSFNFTITPAAGGTTWEYDGVDAANNPKRGSVQTKAGIANGVKVKEAAKFAPNPTDLTNRFGTTVTVGNKTYSAFTSEAKFEIDELVFKNADYGTYEYNLEEVDSHYEGVRYSTSKFKLYVMKYHKTENGQEKDHLIAKVVRTEASHKFTDVAKQCIGAKVEGIENNYGNPTPPETPDIPPVTPPGGTPPTEDPNDTTHVVHIAKKITGNASVKTKKFAFEVYVIPSSTAGVTEDATGQKEREQYAVINESAENVSAVYVEASTQAEVDNKETNPITGVRKLTFEAADSQGVKITGLTKGDKVVVKEVDQDNTYVVTAGEDQTNYATTGSGQLGSRINKTAIAVDAKRQLDFNVEKNEAKVVVTNDKNNITPTGIVMNVAPYAMMLAVAGGLGVVFVNRKKEEE